MCGVLLVRSSHQLNHEPALNVLKRRGPDYIVSKQIGNTFVAQSVLHITGKDDFYKESKPDAFAYNGEIYNYRHFGAWANDVELAYHSAISRPTKFAYFEGPWSWAWSNGNRCLYASDPQGEKALYQYQDSDTLIVCSEIAPILTYVDLQLRSVPYKNKCWTMISQTPWQGISRCEPGRLYIDGRPDKVIDSIWSWIKPSKPMTEDDAYYAFEDLWDKTTKMLIPECPASLSYSGGLDSSLILNSIPNLELVSINISGKDPIVERIRDFLNKDELSHLLEIKVNEQQWAELYLELLENTKMPAQSWSHVGQYLVAKSMNNRVLFTGTAADELFGGYDVYQTLDYNLIGSASPYSTDDHEDLWQRCLDVYHGDPRQATLLMDYWYQIIGMDAPGIDRYTGRWGKEARNPFMIKSIMEFALNLPWEIKVGKKQIKRKFLRRWPETLILPKRGFAGHANDSLPWLNIKIDTTNDRMSDWRQIAQQTYYEYNQTHQSVDTLDY